MGAAIGAPDVQDIWEWRMDSPETPWEAACPVSFRTVFGQDKMMGTPETAKRGTEEEYIREIRAVLEEYPALMETLPPVERAVAEALCD